MVNCMVMVEPESAMTQTVTTEGLSNKHLVDEPLWNRLVARVVKQTGHESSTAARIMDQALGFLCLVAAEPEARYSPSPAIDEGWHVFLQYTRQYAEFSERIAGRFIHHSPMDDPGEFSDRNVPDVVAAMQARGMAVDIDLWNEFATGECRGSKCYTCVE